MPITNEAITININGRPLGDSYNNLLECVVDQGLFVPDMFTLLLYDENLELVDSADFNLGNSVEILTGIEEGDSVQAELFKGEITAVEPSFEGSGTSKLTIRGYDKSWRGYRGTQENTFLKQKDSDILSKIISGMGVTGNTESTKTTHEYIAQDNQSNREYLLERAQRSGLKVHSETGGKLRVNKADGSTNSLTVKLGNQLQSFETRLTGAHQVSEVTVKGWDGKKKEAIVAKASSSTSHPSINVGGSGVAVSLKAFGEAKLLIADQPVFDTTDAQTIAQGHLDRLNGSFVQAEGVVNGAPGIRPGTKLKIEGVGSKFSGDYLVTTASHVYSQDTFTTTFTVQGLSSNTFSNLLNRDEAMRRWYGVYPALVTNVQDPDNLARIKVKFPWIDDNFESDWARIASPDAGPERGIMWIPEVGDEVLVAFEHGDINHPYIIGGLWNSKDKPPKPSSEAVSGGKVVNRMIKTRSGHVLLFDDTQGKEKIILHTKSEGNGHTITLDDAETKMTIESARGVKIAIDGKAGTMKIETNGDVEIKSKANMKFDAVGNIDIKAKGNLNMEATANASIKGLQLNAEGKTQTTLKGLTVSVQGSTLTEVKGALVKIN